MGSMTGKVYRAAMPSMAMELTARENSEDASRWKPMNFHPARNRGTFSKNASIPTENWGSTALMTCARPVMPPMATWLEAKKMSNDRANSTEPTVMMP